ncbi:MAG: exopolysaccharide biosynthesis protein [Hyphomonadaceae bacterium]|nr:exopolysaccharide biosynthesis protein [Hyphomonadaceae bacterium]
MDSLVENTEGETLTARDLLDAVGRRSYGPVLLLLGFVSISPLTIVPGANTVTSLLILVISAQIPFGRKYPWVPKRALEFEFKRDHLLKAVEMSRGYVQRVDALLRPRLTFLTEAPFAQLVALICVAAALVCFPLSFVPFGPVLPGIAVMLFGLGLTSRDGLVIVGAAASLAGSVYLLFRLWNRIAEVFGLA